MWPDGSGVRFDVFVTYLTPAPPPHTHTHTHAHFKGTVIGTTLIAHPLSYRTLMGIFLLFIYIALTFSKRCLIICNQGALCNNPLLKVFSKPQLKTNKNKKSVGMIIFQRFHNFVSISLVIANIYWYSWYSICFGREFP